MICYESWWPEIPRILAVKGSDMIVFISAATQVTEKGFDIVLAMRAMENGYIRFEVDVAEPREVMWWAFFWGSNLEIIEQGWLREYAKKEIGEMSQIYG